MLNPNLVGKPDIFIKNGIVLTLDHHFSWYTKGGVSIKNGIITGVGRISPSSSKVVIDARGGIIMPGFVNSHMHETLSRGLNEDLPLEKWLSKICFPFDKAYDANILRAAARMNQLEMIRGGITTFADIYRFPGTAAQVAEDSGLRAFFIPQIMDSAKGAGETLDSAQTFINEWNGRNRRIGVGFGPHAPYSCSESLFREVVHRAKNIGVRIHTHLAETRFEVDFIKNREGISPVEWLDKLGLLGPWCWIAHGVHLNSEEIALLSKRRVAVAYNPTSNMKLASGIPPIIKMLRQGICVALGTDSNLSNNNLDMFEEMRVGAGLQKLASMDASAISCDQILRMATRNGACALGMESEIGSLEVGKKADVIILDCESPHMWPLLSGEIFNVPEQIVYSANAADVATTIVDGKILMLDRKVTTLDEKSVRSEVERAIQTLITKAGVGKFLKKRHPPSGMFHGKG